MLIGFTFIVPFKHQLLQGVIGVTTQDGGLKLQTKAWNSSHAALPQQYNQSQYSHFGQLNDVTYQTIHGLQIRSIMKLQKLCKGMYLTNSLTHWPQCHCDTKASIKNMWGQSVIMTLQLLAADWYRWRHNRSIALYTLKSWAVAEWNVDLCYLSDRNHISDRCTKYMELIMFDRYYERSTRHLSFSGDSGYFSQFW